MHPRSGHEPDTPKSGFITHGYPTTPNSHHNVMTSEHSAEICLEVGRTAGDDQVGTDHTLMRDPFCSNVDFQASVAHNLLSSAPPHFPVVSYRNATGRSLSIEILNTGCPLCIVAASGG